MAGGTFFGINTALRGLMVHQRALQTTAHNIANASTEGYTRQRVVMVPTLAYPVPAMNRPGGQGWQVGTGVDVQEIRRIRDEFLDSQIRRETGTLGRWEQIQYILEQVEIVFNEPSDTGLSTLLSQFWASWQELAKNAESSPVRMTVIETAAALAEAFNHSARQLDNIRQDIEETLRLKIDEINLLSQQIADLNAQIKSIVTAGDQPNDLLDRRDLLLDQLSKIIDFTINYNSDGTIRVLVGKNGSEIDITAVGDDGKIVNTFTIHDTDKSKVLLVDQELTFDRGQIRGLQEAYDLVNEYRRDLDTLAAELAGAINALHEAGYGIENPPQSRSFFVPETGIDAGNISVNGELRSNPMLIAAATTVNVDIPETLGSDAVGKGLVLDASYQIVVSDSGLQLQKSTDGGTTWTDVGGVVTSITWDGATPVTVGDSNESITFTTSTSSPPRGNYEVTLVTASPGDGSNALEIAQLQHQIIQGLGTTFDDYYKNLTARLGVEGHEAGRMVANQQALVDQLAGRRESISGVALDEEMTYMIQFQRGYEAAARLMTVLDEMLDTLINRMAAH
ncbi:flagellar hook-associated protein FlgK [Moorellaceae bacterium AZ2]